MSFSLMLEASRSFGELPFTPLCSPLEEQWKKIEKKCLDLNIEFDSEAKSKFTSLTFCIKFLNNLDLCKELLNWGADINEKDSHGDSPLMLALSIKDELIAELLIQEGADITDQLKDGTTLLHYAAFKGLKKTCKLLVQNGLDINHLGFPVADQTFLNLMLKSPDPLINEKIKHVLTSKGQLTTPLHSAIINSHVETMKWLILHGANIQARDCLGIPLLGYAYALQNAEMIFLLIGAGASVQDKVFSPIHKNPLSLAEFFIHQNNLKSLELLFIHGLNTGQVENLGGLLSLAVEFGFCDIAKFLLEKGASPNQKIKNGETPLHRSLLRAQNSACIDLLLKAGADVNILNDDLLAPLCYILELRNQSEEILQTFKDKNDGSIDKINTCRFIGHRFGVRDTFYEGFRVQVTLPGIINSLQSFLDTNPQNVDLFYSALEMLKLSNQYMADADFFIGLCEKKEPAILSLGWPRHALSSAIFGNFFFKGNRGNGSLNQTGFGCFLIQKPENLQTAIKKLFEMEMWVSSAIDSEIAQEMKINSSRQFFNCELHELLGLEPVFFQKQNLQPSGNCGMIAPLHMLQFALIIAHLQKGETIEAANLCAIKAYKKWSLFDRMYRIKQLEELENSSSRKTLEKYVDFEDLNRAILFRNLKGSRIEIIQSILNKNISSFITFRELFQAVFSLNAIQAVEILKKMSPSDLNSMSLERFARFCCEFDKGFAFLLISQITYKDEKLGYLKSRINVMLFKCLESFDSVLTRTLLEKDEEKKSLNLKNLSEITCLYSYILAIEVADKIPLIKQREEAWKHLFLFILPINSQLAYEILESISTFPFTQEEILAHINKLKTRDLAQALTFIKLLPKELQFPEALNL